MLEKLCIRLTLHLQTFSRPHSVIFPKPELYLLHFLSVMPNVKVSRSHLFLFLILIDGVFITGLPLSFVGRKSTSFLSIRSISNFYSFPLDSAGRLTFGQTRLSLQRVNHKWQINIIVVAIGRGEKKFYNNVGWNSSSRGKAETVKE